MHRVYWYLLRLLPASFRNPFAGVTEDGADVIEEMYSIYMDASQDALGRGAWHYLAFCLKEIGGLLMEAFASRTSIPRRWLYVPGGAVAGFAVAFLVALYMGPETYTSVAILRDTLDDPLEPYFQVPKQLPSKAFLAEVLTNKTMAVLIENNNLNSGHPPSESSIAQVRANVAFEDSANPGEFLIRYTNRDRFVAQKVVQELVHQVFSARIRNQASETRAAEEFLNDQLKLQSLEWDRLQTSQSDMRGVRLEALRASYESLARQLAEARTVSRISLSRFTGVEMLNPATLPFSPDLDYTTVQLAGSAFGALAGLLFLLFTSRTSQKAAMGSGDGI